MSRLENTDAHNRPKKPCTLSAPRTRGASMSAQLVASHDESAASIGVVNVAFARDPTNYSEAMRSYNRDGWTKAMEEEIATLEDKNIWRVVKRA